MRHTDKLNARTLYLGLVLLLGLLAAFFAGDAIANDRFVFVFAGILVAVALTIGSRLGRNIWVLIPFTATASGSISVLPLPFNYTELGILAAGTYFALQIVFKRARLVIPWQLVDKLIWINMIWLVVTFVRNPVGFGSFGSDMVGGRSVTLVFTFAGYFILSQSFLRASWAYKFTGFLAFFMALPPLLVTVSELVPAIAPAIYPLYSGVSIEGFKRSLPGEDTNRITGLLEVSRPMMLALCAYYPPITLFSPLHPVRVVGNLLGLALAGLSGFRSMILAAGGYMAISTILRGRFRDLYILAAIGCLGVICVLSAHQAGIKVPIAMQRALAFLPLDWDPEAIRLAEGTSEWRMSMWRDAWNDPNIMRDKIFGDGFGFTAHEMMIFSDELLGIGGFYGVQNTYESFMIRGSFHNGPLSSIRYGGAVGLFLLAV